MNKQSHFYAYLCNNEEIISRFSLHYDLLSIFKLHRLQGIGYSQPLPLLKGFCKTQTFNVMEAKNIPSDFFFQIFRGMNSYTSMLELRIQGSTTIIIIIITMLLGGVKIWGESKLIQFTIYRFSI